MLEEAREADHVGLNDAHGLHAAGPEMLCGWPLAGADEAKIGLMV